jgi:hypothetical protein
MHSERCVGSLAETSDFTLDRTQAEGEACIEQRFPDSHAGIAFRAKARDLRFEEKCLAVGPTRWSLGFELHARFRFRR